jgi:hypothetical protein
MHECKDTHTVGSTSTGNQVLDSARDRYFEGARRDGVYTAAIANYQFYIQV